MEIFFIGFEDRTTPVYDGGEAQGWAGGCVFGDFRLISGVLGAAKRPWIVNPRPFCDSLTTPVKTGRRLIHTQNTPEDVDLQQ
jgi:hypothetical protein